MLEHGLGQSSLGQPPCGVRRGPHLPSKAGEERQDRDPQHPAVSHLPLSLGLSFLNVVSSQALGIAQWSVNRSQKL